MIGTSIAIFRFVNRIMFGGGVQLNIYLETVVVVVVIIDLEIKGAMSRYFESFSATCKTIFNVRGTTK